MSEIGVSAAIALSRAGIDDCVILEAGDGVGGAWHWNTYPGIAVDIPSFSYQFSYRKRSDWSRVYAPGDELKAYAEDCVDHYGLRPRLRLDTAITGAKWDEGDRLWHLEANGGEPVRADTAKAMRDDHERCLAAGANDYLAKPLDVDMLLSLLRVWMPKT